MRLSKITAIGMVSLFSTTFVSAQVQAECNVGLPYEQLVDCIVAEGSGEQYSVVEKQDVDTTSEYTIEKNQKKPDSNDLVLSENGT